MSFFFYIPNQIKDNLPTLHDKDCDHSSELARLADVIECLCSELIIDIDCAVYTRVMDIQRRNTIGKQTRSTKRINRRLGIGKA